jgi:hypothetical protein
VEDDASGGAEGLSGDRVVHEVAAEHLFQVREVEIPVRAGRLGPRDLNSDGDILESLRSNDPPDRIPWRASAHEPESRN